MEHVDHAWLFITGAVSCCLFAGCLYAHMVLCVVLAVSAAALLSSVLVLGCAVLVYQNPSTRYVLKRQSLRMLLWAQLVSFVSEMLSL
jgi:hypothetical protein